MIVSNSNNIGDLFYQNRSYSEAYFGSRLVFKKKTEDEEHDYSYYDVVAEWASRTFYSVTLSTRNDTVYASSVSNARNASSLCMRLGSQNTRNNLAPYLEDSPSNITKFRYSDLTTSEVTSLDYAFSSFKYLYGGFFNDSNNTYLTKILYWRIPSTVTSINYLLYNCSTLTEMTVDWDLSNVSSAESPFLLSIPTNFTLRGKIKGIKFDVAVDSMILDEEGLQVFINGLEEVSSTQIVTFNKNNYNSLTEEQKQSITDKGWTIASAS